MTTCCVIYYNSIMLKTYLYIPEQLGQKIHLTAKTQNKSKAEVMRQALERGIINLQQQGIASVQALFKIAEIGKRHKPKGPKDLSSNLDKYLWGIGENQKR